MGEITMNVNKFKAAALARSRHKRDSTLAAVRIEVDGDYAVAVGTDGKRMVVTMHLQDRSPGDFSCVIPAQLVATMEKVPKRYGRDGVFRISVSGSGSGVSVRFPDGNTINAEQDLGAYPPGWRNLLPRKASGVIPAFKPAEMAFVHTVLSTLDAESDRDWQVRYDGYRPAIFTVPQQQTGILIMPYAHTPSNMAISECMLQPETSDKKQAGE